MRQISPSFRHKELLLIVFFLAFAPFGAVLWGAPALGLEVKEFKTVDGNPIHVRYGNYPICESVVRLKANGSNVVIAPENITLVDNTLPARPFEVSAPDATGWQTVRWNNRSAGF